MKFEIPKIYPITDTRLSGLSHAEQVEKLIAGGAKLIQLREKEASPRAFFEAASKAIDVAHKKGVKIIINDRVDIALTLKADGVHLGQVDMPPEMARSILGDQSIIGFSTHSVGQAVAASRLPVDYIAIGPVFQTMTKEDPDEVIGLDGLRNVCENIGKMPLVAIGGINEKNLLAVLSTGANSVAVISAIVGDTALIDEQMRLFRELST